MKEKSAGVVCEFFAYLNLVNIFQKYLFR